MAVASNAAGSAQSNAAIVTVDPLPSIPLNTSLFVGTDLSLSANVNGAGLTYQWQFEPQGAHGFGDIHGATSSTYEVGHASAADAGTYRLRVTNALGSVISNEGAVVLEGAPQITQQPQGATLVRGHALALSASASGQSLTWQWLKDGQAIVGATSSNYGLGNVSLTDSGNYSVVVSNPAGSATSEAAAIVVVACNANTDCAAGETCDANQCVSDGPTACTASPDTCAPGSSCDGATGLCKPDYLAGGCASAEGGSALSLLALFLLAARRRSARAS